MKTLLLTLLLLIPLLGNAQPEVHVLNGSVHIKFQGSYDYQVMFVAKNGVVEGYSITSGLLQGDMKTAIKGTVNVKEHTLKFKEQKPGTPGMVGACYFDVTLTWVEKAGKVVFTGTFVGYDANEQRCDQGTVTMELPKDTDRLFSPNAKKRRQPVKKTPPPMPAEEPVVKKETIKVTATEKKDFNWRSDSCVMEIWDGEYVDGDIVTVLLNGEKVLSGYSLTAGKKRLVLPLRQKSNVLSIVAENEGQAPPNTSQITLTDGSTTYSMLSCLKAGETATITLKKKK